jgi:hypothetical protein
LAIPRFFPDPPGNRLTNPVLFDTLAKHLCHFDAQSCNAPVAQSAERNHGKVEVSGSIPLGSSFTIIFLPKIRGL